MPTVVRRWRKQPTFHDPDEISSSTRVVQEVRSSSRSLQGGLAFKGGTAEYEWIYYRNRLCWPDGMNRWRCVAQLELQNTLTEDLARQRLFPKTSWIIDEGQKWVWFFSWSGVNRSDPLWWKFQKPTTLEVELQATSAKFSLVESDWKDDSGLVSWKGQVLLILIQPGCLNVIPGHQTFWL